MSIRRIDSIEHKYCYNYENILKCFGNFECYDDVNVVDKWDNGDNGFYKTVVICIKYI